MGIKYVFNPTTGNLDATSVETPAGSDTQVQFNDGGSFGGDSGLVFNKTTNKLTAGGDVELNDGGSFTTTLQTVTPTANRTISFPDATGTVGLVAGSSGQVVYNNAGAYAGVSTMTFDGTSVTLAGRLINSYTSLASSPAKVFTGTWFTGGTSTTTKPHFLIEPSGATSTAWSTSGTGLGVNAASGFTGNLLDLQVNGSSQFSVNPSSGVNLLTTGSGSGAIFTSTNALGNASGSSVNLYTSLAPNAADQRLGQCLFGSTSGATRNSAAVTAFSEGSWTLGTSHPTYIVFATTASGSATRSERLRITAAGALQLADASDIAVGTTTGTKIGTATTQKLGFYNKTPVVQPTAVADATDAATAITQLNALLARMRDLGLIAT
jgi:hypothetical protein